MTKNLALLAILLPAACSGSNDPGVDIKKMSFEEHASYQQLASFIAAGGDVNKPGSEGTTPLHLAIHRRHGQLARYLLSRGADVNSTEGLMTPLQVAIAFNDLELVRLLLSRGAEVQVVTLPAKIREAENEVQKLSAAAGTRLSIRLLWPEVPRTPPLLTALQAGRVDMARLLFEKGAKVRAEGIYASFPLHDAVRKNQLEIAKLLIEFGEDVNGRDEDTTPLHVAGWTGNLEMARLLVDKGAEVNVRMKDGSTPLGLALQNLTDPFGVVSEPPRAAKELDEAHKAVAEFLRARGAKN
jgi:ankyrin repeat protein